MSPPTCAICGGERFSFDRILWPELVAEWRLSPEERDYVDRQQAGRCLGCGANLRSIALARAIATGLGGPGERLTAALSLRPRLRILEINEAGTLTPILAQQPGYVFASYPAVDIHALPFPDASFDLVVHSDTLEHVERPVRALGECRRVLEHGGACCYTVPVVVARMTATREGLSPSYHGYPSDHREDYRVVTEYGADAWTQGFAAGFARIGIECVDYPSALAWVLWSE